MMSLPRVFIDIMMDYNLFLVIFYFFKVGVNNIVFAF